MRRDDLLIFTDVSKERTAPSSCIDTIFGMLDPEDGGKALF